MSIRSRKFLLIVLFFGVLALLELNTLALHPTTYVPRGDTSDYYHFNWNYWWVRYALTHGMDIYHTHYILYPLGEINLGLHTLTLIWFPVWALIQPLTGYILAMNILIWLSCVLTGMSMFLMVREYTHHTGISLMCGAFLMALPYIGRAAELNHLNLLGIFYYPLTVLLWKKTVETRSWRWAVVLGFVFWGMWITDTMWLIFTPVIMLPYGFYMLFKHWSARRQLTILAAISILLFVGLSYGILPWRQAMSFDRSTVSPADRVAAEHWSVDWDLYLLQPGNLERGHSIGHVLMILVVITLFVPSKNNERWLWLGIGLLGVVMSVGPDITIAGRRIDLPYWYLHRLLIGFFRTPERFVLPAVFGFLMFLALTWVPYIKTLNRKTQIMMMTVLMLIIIGDLRIFRPLDAQPPIPPYDIHEIIAQEPGNLTVMQIPVSMSSGWAEVGTSYYTQYYGIILQKPIVNGHVSRIPDFSHYYYTNEAVLGWLADKHDYRDEIPEIFRQHVTDWSLGYVIAYQNMMGEERDRTQQTIGHLNGMDFLCPVTVERDAVFYHTSLNPQPCPPRRPAEVAPGTWEIDFGQPGDEIFIGLGFHRKEIIGGPTARWIGADDIGEADIYIDLIPNRDYTLTLEATAFHESRQIQAMIGDTQLSEIDVLPEGYRTYTILIPAEQLGESGKIKLRFLYDKTLSAASLGLSKDERSLAIAISKVQFQQVSP